MTLIRINLLFDYSKDQEFVSKDKLFPIIQYLEDYYESLKVTLVIQAALLYFQMRKLIAGLLYYYAR